MTDAKLQGLLADLVAETALLDDLLVTLTDDEWELPTPAEGWAVRDQISHLAFFDESAVLAATKPDRFRVEADRLKALGPGFPDEIARKYHHLEIGDLASWFRSARSDLILAFGSLESSTRVPWYGPDMSVLSSATARLMETWAHTQDLFDTFNLERTATDRLKHIAHLGVRTMGFSFALNGREIPGTPVRVVLEAPRGDAWEWGPTDAQDSVTGSALGFCLVVTQRRHVSDTDLVVEGPVATEWISIAQAFAGAPSGGRAPLTESRKVS